MDDEWYMAPPILVRLWLMWQLRGVRRSGRIIGKWRGHRIWLRVRLIEGSMCNYSIDLDGEIEIDGRRHPFDRSTSSNWGTSDTIAGIRDVLDDVVDRILHPTWAPAPTGYPSGWRPARVDAIAALLDDGVVERGGVVGRAGPADVRMTFHPDERGRPCLIRASVDLHDGREAFTGNIRLLDLSIRYDAADAAEKLEKLLERARSSRRPTRAS